MSKSFLVLFFKKELLAFIFYKSHSMQIGINPPEDSKDQAGVEALSVA